MQLTLLAKRYWKSSVCVIIIGYLLFTPAKDLPKISFLNFKNSDKLIHIFLFMTLEYFLLIERKDAFDKLKYRTILKISCFAIFYGGFSEIIQLLLIKSRTGSWFDFLADCIGVIVAYCVFSVYTRVINRSSSPTP
jgi:VanZ family protein